MENEHGKYCKCRLCHLERLYNTKQEFTKLHDEFKEWANSESGNESLKQPSELKEVEATTSGDTSTTEYTYKGMFNRMLLVEEELRKVIARLQIWREWNETKEIRQLKKENKRLWDALEEYGTHQGSCRYASPTHRRNDIRPCTCGLIEALKK